MQKINKPYIIYLIKSISLCSLYQKFKVSRDVEFHEAWIILRILKQMLTVTRCFSQAGRYFKEGLRAVVETLRPILSF